MEKKNDTGVLHVWTMEHRLEKVWAMAAMKLASCQSNREHEGIIDECVYLSERLYDAVYHGGMVKEPLPDRERVSHLLDVVVQDATALRENLLSAQRSGQAPGNLPGLIYLCGRICDMVRLTREAS
jgi:hypothetical protein